MAEDVLTYRVELDTSDVSNQILQLQDQIKAETGAAAFSNFSSNAPPFMPGVTGGTPAFGDYGEMVEGFENPFKSLNEAMSHAQLGYEKFSSALVNQGLLAGSPYLEVGDLKARGFMDPSIPGVDIYNSVLARSRGVSPMEAGLESLLMSNYDPRLPLSRQEYQTLFKDRAFNSVAAQAAIGTALSIPLDIMTFGASSLIMPDYEAMQVTQQRGDFMRGVSFRSAGGVLDPLEATQVAGRIGQWQDSGYARDTKLGMAEIDTLVQTFAGAGGFDSATNVNDFKTTVDTLISNARNVMHTLHMSTQEAAQFMGQMSQMGVTNYTSMESITSVLANAPATMGLTPGEALNLGMQSTNMVQGTNIPQGVAFLGGIASGAMVHGLQAGGFLNKETVDNFGGVTGMGASNLQSALNYANSSMGVMLTASLMADPGSADAGMMERMDNAAGYLMQSGPLGYFDVLAQNDQLVKNFNVNQLLAFKAGDLATTASMLNLGNISPAGFEKFAEMSGLSKGEAATARAVIQSMITGDFADLDKDINLKLGDLETPFVSPFEKLMRSAGRGLGTVAETAIIGTMYAMGSVGSLNFNRVNYKEFKEAVYDAQEYTRGGMGDIIYGIAGDFEEAAYDIEEFFGRGPGFTLRTPDITDPRIAKALTEGRAELLKNKTKTDTPEDIREGLSEARREYMDDIRRMLRDKKGLSSFDRDTAITAADRLISGDMDAGEALDKATGDSTFTSDAIALKGFGEAMALNEKGTEFVRKSLSDALLRHGFYKDDPARLEKIDKIAGFGIEISEGNLMKLGPEGFSGVGLGKLEKLVTGYEQGIDRYQLFNSQQDDVKEKLRSDKWIETPDERKKRMKEIDEMGIGETAGVEAVGFLRTIAKNTSVMAGAKQNSNWYGNP